MTRCLFLDLDLLLRPVEGPERSEIWWSVHRSHYYPWISDIQSVWDLGSSANEIAWLISLTNQSLQWLSSRWEFYLVCDTLCDNQLEILSQSCYSHDQKNSMPIFLCDFKAFLEINSITEAYNALGWARAWGFKNWYWSCKLDLKWVTSGFLKKEGGPSP